MSKNFLFKFAMLGSVLAALIVWIISISTDLLKDLPMDLASLIITIVAGSWGIGILSAAFISKTVTPLKKVYAIVGSLLIALAVLTCLNTFIQFGDAWIPIVACVGVGALMMALLAGKGKSWDTADNQKVGYKNYYERKAEEEKAKADAA